MINENTEIQKKILKETQNYRFISIDEPDTALPAFGAPQPHQHSVVLETKETNTLGESYFKRVVELSPHLGVSDEFTVQNFNNVAAALLEVIHP